MSLPQDPYRNRGPIEYTSVSAVAFSPPIRWVQVITAGSGGLVVKDEGGASRTYTGLVSGEVLFGPFAELTSMTLSKIRVGDGPAPTSSSVITPPATDADYTVGTALTDTATTTVNRAAKRTSFLLAGTMSQGETITLGTVAAAQNDRIKIIRTSTSAQTATIVNGGAGTGTLIVLAASKKNFFEAVFDGTNWLFDMCGLQ